MSTASSVPFATRAEVEGPIQIPMGWPISFAKSQNPYKMLISSDGDYVAARDQPPGWVLARAGHVIRVAFRVEQ